jgi:hypothetical protein
MIGSCYETTVKRTVVKTTPERKRQHTGQHGKACQFVNHVTACYPNQVGWEVST